MTDEFAIEDFCLACAGKADRPQPGDVWHLLEECRGCGALVTKCEADFYDGDYRCRGCGMPLSFIDVNADGVPV